MLEMESNQEIIATKNGTHSSLSKSESFRESKWFRRIMSPSTFDKCCFVLAEVLGTATLMFIGCASTIHWDGSPVSLMPPLSFGLTVMLIIQIFGHISFAILNPAVAICAVVNNLMSIKMAIMISIAECVGAIIGYGMLQFFTPADIFGATEHGTCMTVIHPGVSVTKGLFYEFFLTSTLMSLICGVWDPRNRKNGDSAPLRIGLGIVTLSIAGGPFTSASMNPARSLGPAFWNWNWTNHWVFWVGPCAAGLFASMFYKIIFWRQEPVEESKSEDVRSS